MPFFVKQYPRLFSEKNGTMPKKGATGKILTESLISKRYCYDT